MTLLFALFIILGIWHLYYENVISNSFKKGIRYDLYALRDRLRMLNISGKIKSKDDKLTYQILDDSICHMINSVDDITVSNYLERKKKYKQNKEYKKVVDIVQNLIEKSENKELDKIDDNITFLGSKALVINHMGWLPYAIAPLFLWFIFSLITMRIVKAISELQKVSERLVYSSDRIRYSHKNVKIVAR